MTATPGKSAAVALWNLLETGAAVPHGTGHLVADARLCTVMARGTGLPADVLFDVFGGIPVKEVRANLGWAMCCEEEDRIRALRNWRAKRDRARREACGRSQEGAA